MDKTVKLLWTGGWDSTYRLLDLVLMQKRTVQPYYIISRSRQTWEVEVKTMDKIKQAVFKKHPQAKDLLLPTIYAERETIKPNESITQQYKRLSVLGHLGDQHDYISRYADQNGLYNLEMCIDTRSPGFFTTYVKPFLIQEPDTNSYNFYLSENLSDPDLTLFKYFKFPIHQLTKQELKDLASQHNFLDILEYSWFCHFPRNRQPCGVCTPCRVTMEHGLWSRIPISGLIRNFIWFTVKPPLKKILKVIKYQNMTSVT